MIAPWLYTISFLIVEIILSFFKKICKLQGSLIGRIISFDQKEFQVVSKLTDYF